jgi:RNA polymerase sigma factor (sigma-70 family)
MSDDILAVLPTVRAIAVRLHQLCHPVVSVEDLYAEGCLAVVVHKERFDPTLSCWRTYAGDKARYAMLDYLRGQEGPMARAPAHHTPPRCPLNEDMPAPPPRPSLQDEVEAVLRRLRPIERTCVWGHYIGGLSKRDVGRMLGYSDSHIHGVIRRALGSLRQALSGREADFL